MSNATLTTSTNFNGIEIDIRIEDDSLQAALAQLEALDGKTKPATKKKAAPKKQKEEEEAPAVDPTPAQEPQVQEEAPTATESALQTSSEADSAPQTDATSSATATTEPSNPEPAVEAPAEAPAKEVTGEDVLASAKKLLSSGPEGEPTLKACLAEVGAQTVGTCPAEKRGDLKAAIDAKLEA